MKVAHVEAGLRSFNRAMPEEINRVVTDHLSDLLFCPTATAIKHLANEGVTQGVYLSGDVMLDAVLAFRPIASKQSQILGKLNVQANRYILFTVHRAENTDSEKNLGKILELLAKIPHPVIFPIHPRTRNRIAELSSLQALAATVAKNPDVLMIDPVSYLDMLALESHARVVMTDSGGVQKEAYFLGVPCLTLRNETEWSETLEGGWNRLVDAGAGETVSLLDSLWNKNGQCPCHPRNLGSFGAGHAAEVLVQQLFDSMSQAGH
jgi:UDP-GlcNAc3NAcA epimerase